jgi:hypothetical protein
MTATNLTLRNGKEVPDVVIGTTMIALRTLADADFMAFCEFVETCRDPGHVIYGDCGDKIERLGLVQSVDAAGHGKVHDAVRDIVLSAVDGEDFGLSLRSPLPDA